MHTRASLAVFVGILLAFSSLAATCGPKDTCKGIQRWNLKSGSIVVATWDAWHDHYRDSGYKLVVKELLEEYIDELTPEVIDELMGAVEGHIDPKTPIVVEIYYEYEARMLMYDKISEKLETTLNYTAESMEIVEHAMISCQNFSNKEIFNALLEASQGLLDIMDILKEAGVPIPKSLMDAKSTADSIIDSLKKD